jgi:hypothetical protein
MPGARTWPSGTGWHQRPAGQVGPPPAPYQNAISIFPLPNVVKIRHSGHDDSISKREDVSYPSARRPSGSKGPLTATRAAEPLGESSGSCSFHLRQLAEYGLAGKAGGGQGRERPWRR